MTAVERLAGRVCQIPAAAERLRASVDPEWERIASTYDLRQIIDAVRRAEPKRKKGKPVAAITRQRIEAIARAIVRGGAGRALAKQFYPGVPTEMAYKNLRKLKARHAEEVADRVAQINRRHK